jgi:heme-degrading monooxygenase HmoA
MIVRAWSAHATEEGAEHYVSHFQKKVVPQLQQIRGYRGALLLRRKQDLEVRVQVLTFWDTMSSIHQFAGLDPDNAVVEEEARAVLQGFDTRVVHFEVVLDLRGSSHV